MPPSPFKGEASPGIELFILFFSDILTRIRERSSGRGHDARINRMKTLLCFAIALFAATFFGGEARALTASPVHFAAPAADTVKAGYKKSHHRRGHCGCATYGGCGRCAPYGYPTGYPTCHGCGCTRWDLYTYTTACSARPPYYGYSGYGCGCGSGRCSCGYGCNGCGYGGWSWSGWLY